MIYICIPTHNEQQTAGVVLWKLRQVFTEYPRDYQLLVADDASTDRTADVLEPYTRVLPLTVIRCDRRLGAAASLEMLLREAVRRSEYPRRDVIVTLQADFSEEPDDVVPFIKRLEAGADVAVGNKVSATKDPRSRRLARSLASFFVRGQKWPEGVATPFDGYRAYRLHAIKRAIEDRAGRRLIRFDGWAGHAELLRAVLPHARRVDVVSVEDRPDRLQRPRRERPFTYAFQVRAMTGSADPAGLVGIEELDRIASTASRSRERSIAVNGSVQPSRGSTNGAAKRGRRGVEDRVAQDDRRARKRPTVADRRAAGQAPAADRPAKGRSNGAAPSAGNKERREDRRRRTTGATAQAAAAQVESPEPVLEEAIDTAASATTDATVADAAGTAEAAPRPKKKRRRRKRGGKTQAGATQVEDVDAAATTPSEPAAVDGEGDSITETTTPSTAKKKRRRGGRRGGRGRRRSKANGAEAGVETAAGPDVVAEAGPAQVADSHSVTGSAGTVDARVERTPIPEVAGGA